MHLIQMPPANEPIKLLSVPETPSPRRPSTGAFVAPGVKVSPWAGPVGSQPLLEQATTAMQQLIGHKTTHSYQPVLCGG